MKEASFAIIVMLSLFSASCRKVAGDGPVITETRAFLLSLAVTYGLE